ncbi:hypothetical protein ACFYRC_36785 [Streptomyces sp. NPDC005279]|uniref:nSTAND1 domain-containing NTPase n=1 Tax=Streptomyces sp. NPDC005279 TaxID=3364712 RepID=UPI0036A8BF63
MTDPPAGGFEDTGPVAFGHGQVTITAEGGDAAGRDINKNVHIGTLVQYLVQQERAVRTDSRRRPYPGLKAFDEGWKGLFHGRERETGLALELLVRAPVSAVVGSSGSGKSSLLAAGVANALRAGALPGVWSVHRLGPTALPVEQLCDALKAVHAQQRQADGTLPDLPEVPEPDRLREDPALFGRLSAGLARRTGGRVVWLIDQFEALLAPELPQHDRDCLVRAVLSVCDEGAGAVHVMIAIRTDLYQRLETNPALATLVATHQFWLHALTGDSLRRAVREPAAKVGLRVEEGLIDQIVREAGAGRGSLPLIAYALERLWQRRTSDELTLAGYQEIGGIAAALDEGAQRAWDDLSAGQRATAQRMFVRLAYVGSGERPTRRTVRARDLINEVDDEKAVLEVVRPFVERRLLSVGLPHDGGEPTVEVAHEVLLEAWEQLHEWLTNDPKAKQLQDEIATQTNRWQEHSQDEDFLLPAGQLRLLDGLDAELWSLNEQERRFVDASRLAEERVRASRRRARRLRTRLVVTGVGLVLALLLSAFTLWQQVLTNEAKKEAEALQLAAQARSTAEERRDVAALLALGAVQKHDAPATRSALVDVLARTGGPLALYEPHCGTDQPNAVTAAPAGAAGADGVVALGCPDGTLRLLNAMTGRQQRLLGGRNTDAVSAVGLTGEGLLVSGDNTGGMVVQRIHGPDSGAVAVRTAVPTRICGVAVDERTGVILAAGTDGVVSRWHLSRSPAGPLALDRLAPVGVAHPLVGIAVHRPGRAAAVMTKNAHVVEIPTAPGTAAVPGTDQMLRAPHEKGRLGLAARAGGGDLSAVDGDRLSTWPGPLTRPPAAVQALNTTAVTSDPGSRTLYTGDASGRIRVWSSGGAPLPKGEVLIGPPGDPVVALSTDGHLLMSFTEAKRLVVWDLSDRRSPAATPRQVSGATVTALAHGPDGTLATGDGAGVLRLSATSHEIFLGSGVDDLAWLSTSTLLAAAEDGALHAVDLANGTHSQVLAPRKAELIAVRTAHDGTAVVAWRDGRVLVRDPDGREHLVQGVTGGEVSALAVGPHREVAVGIGRDAESRILLWPEGRVNGTPRRLAGHGQFVSALAFSPDGRTLASGSDDRSVRLWDTHDGYRTRELLGHEDTVTALVWASNDMLASSGEDGTVRMWDRATGSRIGNPLRYSDASIPALSASPDGADLIAASAGLTVRWPFAPHAWSALACTFSGGSLTSALAAQYAPGHRRSDLLSCPAADDGE